MLYARSSCMSTSLWPCVGSMAVSAADLHHLVAASHQAPAISLTRYVHRTITGHINAACQHSRVVGVHPVSLLASHAIMASGGTGFNSTFCSARKDDLKSHRCQMFGACFPFAVCMMCVLCSRVVSSSTNYLDDSVVLLCFQWWRFYFLLTTHA